MRLWKLIMAGTLALGILFPASAQDPRAEAESLARENRLLAKRAELAEGKDFYLLLDPSRGKLLLMLKNAILQDFTVEKLEVGLPTVIFKTRNPDSEWQGEIWSNGELDPPRTLEREVIIAPPPTREGVELQVKVPPTPEEKYPVPARYWIRFDGGLAIEIRTTQADPKVDSWTRLKVGFEHWLADAQMALSGEPTDQVRIRLRLPASQAQSLFRGLPPKVKLLVLPRTH